jgi:hypothetical protein
MEKPTPDFERFTVIDYGDRVLVGQCCGVSVYYGRPDAIHSRGELVQSRRQLARSPWPTCGRQSARATGPPR